ncbi:hypothetical protein Tco_0562335 [Tanacetum coccineum]
MTKVVAREGSRKYLKIIRFSDVTVAYQSFKDMLKGFDREDLVALWSLVKERFRSAEPTEDMKKALWVKLKRLFEPDKDDVLWKLQRYMHDPLTWRFYGSCGVHHISSTRGHDIYMFQVEEDSEVKRLEDKIKSTNERKKAKMVISDEGEELVLEDSSKQGRMEETEYADVEEENTRVEYDFDLTKQQLTPLKAPQVEVQCQETFEDELRLFSTAEDIQDTDDELAKKFDQERKAADDIDWSKIVEQAQERQSGSMIRYHSFKKKPVTVAQARKNMMVYLKNMANYKMKYFKGMSYDQIRPIFEEEYRKVQTLFKKDSEVSKSEKKRVCRRVLPSRS